jgi:hypothetical protein
VDPRRQFLVQALSQPFRHSGFMRKRWILIGGQSLLHPREPIAKIRPFPVPLKIGEQTGNLLLQILCTNWTRT